MRARTHKSSKYLVLMLTLLWSAALISGAAWGSASPEAAPSSITKVQAVEAYGRLPLAFIENQGQVNSQVKYFTRGQDHAVFFTTEGMTLGLSRHGGKDGKKGKSTARVQLRPLGIRPGVEVAASEPLEGKVNYFRGNDPGKWLTNVPTYKSVLYREAYAGIDLKFYGTGQQMEYDLIVKPGADPKQVKFLYQGIKSLKVSKAGELVVTLPDGGKLVQKTPVIYQDIEGQRISRQGKFRILAGTKNRGYGFELASYDARYPLVIDPITLVYSTYLGGSTADSGNAIAVDATGSAYVAGSTFSSDLFPPGVSPRPYAGGQDVFVAKLNPAGNALTYATYLGGAGDDEGMGIALDAANNAYVTGLTGSSDFPTTATPAQGSIHGVTNAFFTKFDATGIVAYSTFLGGTGSDMGKAIAVDSTGNAIIAGDTNSTDFPHTGNARQPNLLAPQTSSNAFISKINPAGAGATDLVYSSYLAGTTYEVAWGVKVNAAGETFVTGDTGSADFPHTNGALTGFINFFVTKFTNLDGNAPAYSTIYGGSLDLGGGGSVDSATGGIALDAAGNAYVAGNTDAANFPTVAPYQANLKSLVNNNAFLVKFDTTGIAVYASYLGGSNSDTAWFTALDAAGNVYVTGDTDSTDFPVVNGLQTLRQLPATSSSAAFVTRFNGLALNTLTYSTFLGGDTQDLGFGIAVDATQRPYVTGVTASTNFPVKGFLPGQGTISGTSSGAAFITKLVNYSLVPEYLLLLLDN